MGFLRIIVYVIVPLIAILAYFQYECMRSKECQYDSYNPELTDSIDALPFPQKGTVRQDHYGFFDFIVAPILPCAVKMLLMAVIRQFSQPDDELNFKNITFVDARKHSPGSFHDTGFTLIQLDEEPDVTDWRTNGFLDPNADVKKFHKQMEPHLMKLYPDTKRIVWTHNVVRGGSRVGDQPFALGPHLDYHPDNELRKEYHREYPPKASFIDVTTEPDILMGALDDEETKLKVLLGVWKPIYPDKICDHPLAVMDVRTMKEELLTMAKTSFNYFFMYFYNLSAGIVYSPEQKWYYYPFQTTQEVLVFHQFTSGTKFFANPHTSFSNKNCPPDTKPRISVEFRVALFS